MGNINLNGIWNLYFDELKELNFDNYKIGRAIEVEVPGAVDKYLEDRTFYGPFFYEKVFFIDLKKDKKYIIDFKGVSYYCEIIVNGVIAGNHEGVWDKFSFDITALLKSGENRIVVKIIKPNYDKNSKYYFRSVLFGFFPDVLLPFGGIWKDVLITEKSSIYFKEINPKFNMKNETLEVEYKINGDSQELFAINDKLKFTNYELDNQFMDNQLRLFVFIKDPKGGEFSYCYRADKEGILKIKIENLILWSTDEPNLYNIKISLFSGDNELDSYAKRIGARRLEIKDGRILLNGNPIYLRGVLHWGYYPEIYTPNPSYECVKEELKKIKDMGFNAVKHCLYFPPEYYYELCDEMGILEWQELPLWLPYPNAFLTDRIYKEYPEMIKLFINHPSVILISLGCELDSTISSTVLKDLYKMVEDRNSGAIICDNSGSGECYDGVRDSKSDIYDYHFYAELHNLEGLLNEFIQSYRTKKPFLFGEFNDTDTWRNIKELKTKIGSLYWADKDEKKNLLRLTHKGFGSDQPVHMQDEIFKEYGIFDEVDKLKEISLKQAYDIRKYILELTRRYSYISGYNITNLRDVSITTSGVFDDFNNPKWSIEEFRKINDDMVLIYSKDLGRVWYRGADRFLSKDLYNFFSEGVLAGKIILSNTTNKKGSGVLTIELLHDEKIIYKNDIKVDITPYDSLNISDIRINLPRVYDTLNCKLKASLKSEDKILAKNDWNIWIYPAVNKNPLIYILDNCDYLKGVEKYFNVKRINSIREIKNKGILVTSYYDEAVEKMMTEGLNVLYIQQGYGYFNFRELPFNREGIKSLSNHPVIDSLKHNNYAGLQFFSLGTDIAFNRLELKSKIGDYKPIISRYDARKFDVCEYMFEYSIGKGRTIVTSLRFQGGQGSQAGSFEENILGIKILDNVVKYFLNL